MLYEMGEAMLVQETDETQDEAVYIETEVKEVPPDREDDFTTEEDSTQYYTNSGADIAGDKTESLRLYLEERLGDNVLVESYRIIRECNKNEDEIGYDKYYPYLKHLMSREIQLEYLPYIQALIDMEGY